MRLFRCGVPENFVGFGAGGELRKIVKINEGQIGAGGREARDLLVTARAPSHR